MEFDKLSLFRAKPIELFGGAKIKQIKLSDIAEIGESKYQEYVGILTTTSVDVADILFFDMGVWFQDIASEWNFFVEKALMDSKDIIVKIDIGSGFIIDNKLKAISNTYRDAINFFLDFDDNIQREYFLWQDNDQHIILMSIYNNGDGFIYDENAFKFTEHYYNMLKELICKINWINKDHDLLHCKTRKAATWKMQDMQRKRKNKRKESLVDLSSIISSLITKGQNYKDIWDFPIYLIYEIYYRLMKIDNYNNLTNAYYTGNIDKKKSKIDFNKLNWSNIIK